MMEKLTLQEEQALQAVFKTGEGNIKTILENMENESPYTTVASTIKNLEKKGVPAKQDGRQCLSV